MTHIDTSLVESQPLTQTQSYYIMGNYLFGYLIFRPEASAILWDPKGSFQLPEKGNHWKSTLDPVEGQPPPKMLTEPRRTKETTVP